MKNIFLYEGQKLLYQKKNWVMLAAIVLLLISFIGYNWYQDANYVEKRIAQLKEVVNDSTMKSKAAAITKSMTSDEEEKKRLTKEAAVWKDIGSTSYLLISEYLYETHQTESFPKTENKWIQALLAAREEGVDINMIDRRSDKELENAIRCNEYIIENDIQLPNSPYSCNFFNLIHLLLSSFYPIVLFAVLLFLIFDMFAVEFDNGSYKLMYSGRARRRSIYLVKYISACCVILAYLLLILGIFLIAGLFFGFGDAYYPSMIGDEVAALFYTDILQLLLCLFGMLFFAAFLEMTGYLFYSSTTAMNMSIAIYVILILFSQIMDMQELYSYLPFYTIYSSQILQYNGAASTILLSCFGSILMFVVGSISFTRKDIKVE